jgi:hypothetical protein
MSAVKRVEFVNDTMSYIILRGRWFHIIVLNVHAPTGDKILDMYDSFCEELEHVLGEFNAKVGREDIFKPTIGNESLHEINNDTGVVNFGNVSQSKVQCSHITIFINILQCLQMGKPTIILIIS